MRDRIAAAKSPAGPWDAKIGAGRLQDIELLAQAGALIAGRSARHIPDGIRAAQEGGLLDAIACDALIQAYEACWQLQCAARLLSAAPLDTAGIGQAGAAFLARSLGCDSLSAAEERMEQVYLKSAHHIDAVLAETGQS